jgi:serine/threonine protein kinase
MAELRLENSIVDDRYRVDRCLGRGSYAEIFLSFDQTRAGDPVIIKALNMSLQGTPDPDLEQTLVENFQNEAIALDKVRHPNIIRRLGHGTAADLRGVPFHYLLLEYMPGGDLLSLCRRRPFDLDAALFCFQQVAEALAYAHSKRVIHRDVKPNNLLLSADHRTVKVADFGVAKMTPEDTDEITRVGTNVYAPPEHHPDSPTDALGEKLTPSADIYSLAKTIYTAMTGRAPRQFARLQITELPAGLAGEPWGEALLAVLRRATAPRPADRYSTVQEFWEELARLSHHPAADTEADPEATVVRSRLSATSTVERAAARPEFHSLATAAYESNRPQKARIVVNLPQRQRPSAAPYPPDISQSNSVVGTVEAQDAATRELTSEGNGALAHDLQGRAEIRTKKLAERREAESTVFDDLRRVINSEWLRRVFIVFLFAALAGIAASVFYYFAGKSVNVPRILSGEQSRDGVIANVAAVNLRSDPAGEILVELPQGTRVRVYESRGKWVRVKVLEWPGAAPENARESGWVDSRFIQLDQ